jgi:hypothetical protein
LPWDSCTPKKFCKNVELLQEVEMFGNQEVRQAVIKVLSAVQENGKKTDEINEHLERWDDVRDKLEKTLWIIEPKVRHDNEERKEFLRMT